MTNTHSISTVKKEIRILGIDACNSRRLVGVIVRGGDYLDGVVTFQYPTRKNGQTSLGDQIKTIPYFPELRAIMLHDPKNRIDADLLEQTTGLPVMKIMDIAKSREGEESIIVVGKGRRLQVNTRLPKPTVIKIIRVTWTYRDLPEPVRISHLLGKSSIGKMVNE